MYVYVSYVRPIVASLLIISSFRGCHVDCRFTSSQKKMSKNPSHRDGDCEWLRCLSCCLSRCCCCLMTYWKFHLKFVYSRSERHSRHSHAHKDTRTHTPTTVRSAVKKIKIKIEQSKMCLCLGSSKQNKTKRREEMRHEQREDVAMCEWWVHYQHLGKPNWIL